MSKHDGNTAVELTDFGGELGAYETAASCGGASGCGSLHGE